LPAAACGLRDTQACNVQLCAAPLPHPHTHNRHITTGQAVQVVRAGPPDILADPRHVGGLQGARAPGAAGRRPRRRGRGAELGPDPGSIPAPGDDDALFYGARHRSLHLCGVHVWGGGAGASGGVGTGERLCLDPHAWGGWQQPIHPSIHLLTQGSTSPPACIRTTAIPPPKKKQMAQIVTEKDSGLRQAMRTMGLMESSYWGSWVVFDLAFATVLALVIVLSGEGSLGAVRGPAGTSAVVRAADPPPPPKPPRSTTHSVPSLPPTLKPNQTNRHGAAVQVLPSQ